MWFRDLGGELWQADLLETQSGHLMIPVQGQLYDLSRLRFGVVDLVSTPGALEELRKSQGQGQKYTARACKCLAGVVSHHVACTCEFGSLCGLEHAPHSDCVVDPPEPQCEAAVHSESVFAMSVKNQLPVVRPSLAQRLGSLALQLAQLRLRRSHGAVQGEGAGPVRRSAPDGLAVLRSPQGGGLKQNQFGRWQTCVRCGLRVFYETTKTGHGKDRSGGATVDIVGLAMDDLQQTM